MKISQLALALCAAAALTPSAALRGDRRAESIEADRHKSKNSRSERTCSVNVGDTLYTAATWVFGYGDGGVDLYRRLQEDGAATTIAPVEGAATDTAAGTPVTADNAYVDEIETVWFPVFKFVSEDAVNTCVYGMELFSYGCGYGRSRNLEEERKLEFGPGFCAVPEDYINGSRRYERKLSSYGPEELQDLKDASNRDRKLGSGLSIDDLPCGMELVGFMTTDGKCIYMFFFVAI